MQLIENSFIGVRSARHRLHSRERAATVTLYPLIHVGEAGFYATVYREAMAHDVVVVEGVRSTVSRRLTRAYRWMRPERLGLIRQPPFDPDGADCKVVHGDLSGEDFDRLWRGAHPLRRSALEIGAAGVGLWLRVTASRASIARHLETTDLPDRDDILGWSPEAAPLAEALMTARDARLCAVLDDLVAPGSGRTGSIAILYGAAHMRAVSGHLRNRHGYHPVQSDWLTVFSH